MATWRRLLVFAIWGACRPYAQRHGVPVLKFYLIVVMYNLKELTFAFVQIPLRLVNGFQIRQLVHLIIAILLVDENVVIEIGVGRFSQLIELLDIVDVH